MATDNGYTQGIYIDGEFFDIPFISIKRTADFLEKYANRNEAGTIIMETIGVYLNYTIKVGMVDDVDLYNKLFDKLIEVDNRMHTVKLPDGMNEFTFVGYFSSISDEVSKVLDEGVQFNSLTWKMTSQKKTQ